MKKDLNKIFDFLEKNREYNSYVQKRYCRKMIGTSEDIFEKFIGMLYFIVNTQSQPRIDQVSESFKKIYARSDRSIFNTFEGTVTFLTGRRTRNFEDLFLGLKSQPGWGNKTAALFTKNIYLIHNQFTEEGLSFWTDVPTVIDEADKFYLPVDSVIISIFNRMDSTVSWDFTKINNLLNHNYSNRELEVWDDLWFWGFINQKGTGTKQRAFEWNEGKYWILEETDKNLNKIQEIKSKSREFRSLLSA